ncbi:cytochrome c oxidase, subunit VIb [Hymenopellis radicata]|nr:cytochrome c oxidase, subunit VIb [Hymenopellis radicata]
MTNLKHIVARSPNQNPPRHCFQSYVDYFRCINAKGPHFAPCQQFKKTYRSLCPSKCLYFWDDQREAGTFSASLKP